MRSDMLRAVAIGGGAGAVQVLSGLQAYTPFLTGLIAVTDTGRSTGKIRELGDMPAPGDIRNALGTLAGEHSLQAELIQYRLQLPNSELLNGLAFGNLMLLALVQMTNGDFAKAVEMMREMLGVKVNILPVTTHSTHLCAELVNGEIILGEVNVRGLHKSPIKRVYLQNPEAKAYEKCIQAIEEADLITIGPGGFFTSVLACLVFDGIVQALHRTKATIVYICNTTTQPGQTDGFSISDHIQHLINHVGEGVVDYAVINAQRPPDDLMRLYAADGLEVLLPTPEEVRKIRAMGVEPVLDDVIEITEHKRDLWQKQDSIWHDSPAIAKTLLAICESHAIRRVG